MYKFGDKIYYRKYYEMSGEYVVYPASIIEVKEEKVYVQRTDQLSPWLNTKEYINIQDIVNDERKNNSYLGREF